MPHISFSRPHRLPFQGLSKKEWINLALLAVAVYFVVKPAIEVFFRNTFTFLGLDFLSFWSAGWLANQRGYLSAYDPRQLAEIQFIYIPKPDDLANYQFYPVITFFLPVFLLLFQALAKVPLTPSFVLWSLVNFFGYIGYLVLFARSLALPIRWRHILLCCLFWPFFQSMFWGQIGLILVIAVGEFFRAFIQAKPWRAGFWLGILMIKPQILVLLPFTLFFQRQWKTLFGFFLTAGILGLISLKLITLQGIGAMLSLSDELANGYPTIGATGMLNWRMIGENLSLLGHPTIGWNITWMGILLTLSLVVYYFASLKINPENSAAVFLLAFAATGLISWHYHIHSAIVLIPFLFYLILLDRIPESWILMWIIIPGAILLFTNILEIVSRLTHWHIYPHYPALLQGGCGLVLSVWTVLKSASLVKNLTST